MKTTYTEEAIADIVEAITYLNDRNGAGGWLTVSASAQTAG